MLAEVALRLRLEHAAEMRLGRARVVGLKRDRAQHVTNCFGIRPRLELAQIPFALLFRLLRLIDICQRDNQSKEGRLALRNLRKSINDFLINDDRLPFAVDFIETTRHSNINGGSDRGQLLELIQQLLRTRDVALELIVGRSQLAKL